MPRPQDGFDDESPTEARLPKAAVPDDSAPASDGGRYVPGTVLAGRYRIVGLLGRGGMGQVYRADDLKLGQAVALKFLPEPLARDGAALARFHQEVRLARQISHPGVCRVFDIGELGGEHFLTMEYIDGEDLGSLLKRIGRLPPDKALEIARQLCAALAAAHDAGVLHRDLKPANVMLDGRGRARITDFGLAGLEAELRAGGDASGTPAYMAPEQLAGREFTRRSEVFALGLLLYELFTGRRFFDAATVPEVLRQRRSGARAVPSSLVKDLDPLVERVILRCLEEDPARRPGSVVHVAAALPGGDPLEAALAAGETPSPEMVAAAHAEGALRPRTAGLALAGIGILLVLLCAADRVNLHQIAPLEKSPEVLADRARTLLAGLGYSAAPVDRAFGFGLDESYLGFEGDPEPAPERWRRLATGQPLTYYYWYRESPMPLEPAVPGRPSSTDPPAGVEGMARLVLDPRGRLVELAVVPPAVAQPAATAPDWTPLLAAAGLDPKRLVPASPQWTVPVASDERAAWDGTIPDHPDLATRIEAAAYAGRPVHFVVATPWGRPTLQKPEGSDREQRAAAAIAIALLGTVLVGGLVLARRNLRKGRDDRGGAFKVAAAVFAIGIAAQLLGADLTATVAGLAALLWHAVTQALGFAALAWLLYLALEPYVRRNRPELIVSWTRLIAGDWRDPMVGRDALAGTLLGLAASASFVLGGWLKVAFAAPQAPNRLVDTAVLGGIRPALGELVGRALGAIAFSFGTLVFVALARRLVRTEARAAFGLWVALWAMQVLFTARSWPMVVATGLASAAAILVVTRLGLVAGFVFQLVHTVTVSFPMMAGVSAFYSGTTAMALGSIAVIAIGAYRIALDTRRTALAETLDLH